MGLLSCPHCGKEIETNAPTHSTFVTRPETVGETFELKEYHENPARKYRTKRAERRARLAYYYRNRETVLAKAREAREKRKLGERY